MADYVISTDSTADLPDSYVKENGLYIQDLHYSFGNEVYGGDNKLDPVVFYDRMRKGEMPTTNATIPEDVKKCFRSILEKGFDIVHIAFSSALSCSCSSTTYVAEELKEEFPDRTIIVIDSLSASLGQGLLVHKAVQKKKEGADIRTLTEYVIKTREFLVHKFTVDDLFHLQRGGRVSKTTAIIGTLINIKPVLHVDFEGRLVSQFNVRGRKKALNSLVDEMEKSAAGIKNDIVFISHGDAPEDAQYVADRIKERLGIDSFLINYICPTIGAHSGPGTVALFFLGNAR